MVVIQRYVTPHSNLRGAIKITKNNRIIVRLYDGGILKKELTTSTRFNSKSNFMIQKWLEGDKTLTENIKIGDFEKPTKIHF